MITRNSFIFRSMNFKNGGTGIDGRTGKQFNYSDRYSVKFDKVVKDELLEFEINVNIEKKALIEKLNTMKPFQEIMVDLELRVYKDTIRLKIVDVSAVVINTTEDSENRLKQFKLFN